MKNPSTLNCSALLSIKKHLFIIKFARISKTIVIFYPNKLLSIVSIYIKNLIFQIRIKSKT